MAEDLAPLIARLEARTHQYEKSLEKAVRKMDGTTNRMNRRWSQGMSSMERRAKRFGRNLRTALATSTALGAGALTVMVKNTLAATDEIRVLAQTAGTSAERFQEMAFGAERYGISQEKLSDQLKDFSEKTAEFLESGSGGMRDFFENIAPAVGVTREQFRGLSSDKALELYVRSLEQAGVSQSEMSFYLEAMASDLTQLMPLLRDGGSGMREMSQKARSLGAVLSDEMITKGSEANQKLKDLSATLRGQVASAIVEMAPEIEDLSAQLMDLVPQLIEWAKAGAVGLENLGGWIERLDDMWQASVFGEGKADPDPVTLRAAEERMKSIRALMERVNEIEEQAQSTSGKTRQFFANHTPLIPEMVPFGVGETADLLNERWELSVKIFGKERTREMNKDGADFRQAIMDEYNRTADLMKELQLPVPEAPVLPKVVKPPKKTLTRKRADSAETNSELDAIRELGRTEKEQIEALRQERLKAIDDAKIAETEKAALRVKVNEDAASEIKKINQELAEEEADRTAAVNQAKRDELDFIAQIAAATARMNGRALDATQIELDARRARYQAEIAEIEALIAKRAQAGLGPTTEQSAALAGAQAGLAGVDASEADFRKRTLENIRGISDGAERTGLSAELARLDQEEQAKIDLANEYRSKDIEFEAAYQEELVQIQAEYDEKRKQAKIESYRAQFDAAASFASDIGESLRTAGLEGTKAAKIAAKAQQGIALGRATMNGALAISEAVASAPFPANLPAIAFATATNGAQIAAIAAATFRDGGVNIRGPGTSRSDSIPARISNGESVITAAATKGNEAGLRGLNAGLSPEQAFGLLQPNLSLPTASVRTSNQYHFGGLSLSLSGDVDQSAIPRLEGMMRKMNRDFAKNVKAVLDNHEKTTVPKHQRPVRAG